MSGATPQTPGPRIQGLSDLIFGLALSIGAIQFVGNIPKEPGVLASDIATFGFSFIILITVWNRYTTTTSVLPVETVWMVRVNILLLFLVAIEPFLFDVMFVQGLGSPVGKEASFYYSFDIGGMNFILAYFTHLVSVEEKNLIPRELVGRFKISRNALLVTGAIFLYSALPAFADVFYGGVSIRVLLWIASFPALWAIRFFGDRW